MNSNTLARLRLVAYVLYAVAGPVLLYTEDKGWTGKPEYELWIGLGTAFGLTAAANVPRVKQRIMAVVKPKDPA